VITPVKADRCHKGWAQRYASYRCRFSGDPSLANSSGLASLYRTNGAIGGVTTSTTGIRAHCPITSPATHRPETIMTSLFRSSVVRHLSPFSDWLMEGLRSEQKRHSSDLCSRPIPSLVLSSGDGKPFTDDRVMARITSRHSSIRPEGRRSGGYTVKVNCNTYPIPPSNAPRPALPANTPRGEVDRDGPGPIRGMSPARGTFVHAPARNTRLQFRVHYLWRVQVTVLGRN